MGKAIFGIAVFAHSRSLLLVKTLQSLIAAGELSPRL
jgi:hypothetical protein